MRADSGQVGGFLVLLGDEHDSSFVDWVRQRPDYASGTFEVRRATFGAGKLVFSEYLPHMRARSPRPSSSSRTRR